MSQSLRSRGSALRYLRTCRRAKTVPLAPATFSASSIARRAHTLAILEQKDGKLQNASLTAVSAAQHLGGKVTGLIAGGSITGVVGEALKVEGLGGIIKVENADYDKGLAENFAPMIVANLKDHDFTHIIAGHTAFGKNVMPRVAALIDSQQISDIMEIKSEDTFVRPIYAGNAILTVQSIDKLKVLTVRGTAFPLAPFAETAASLPTKDGVDPAAPMLTTWISESLAKSERPELTTAGRVVSGGRGLKSKADFDKLIPPLADALGAAIGASRAAVDSGFADNSLQVGQTGKNVAPELYLCAGISGAIQHLAGMKDSKVIAAINKDAEAPIFQVADVGVVGDLFDMVPDLTAELEALKKTEA